MELISLMTWLNTPIIPYWLWTFVIVYFLIKR